MLSSRRHWCGWHSVVCGPRGRRGLRELPGSACPPGRVARSGRRCARGLVWVCFCGFPPGVPWDLVTDHSRPRDAGQALAPRLEFLVCKLSLTHSALRPDLSLQGSPRAGGSRTRPPVPPLSLPNTAGPRRSTSLTPFRASFACSPEKSPRGRRNPSRVVDSRPATVTGEGRPVCSPPRPRAQVWSCHLPQAGRAEASPGPFLQRGERTRPTAPLGRGPQSRT